MSNIKITDYKNHEIFYSEDEDKFICEIELNEDLRKMKRVSLKAVKDEIDQFIKANIGFVPFKVVDVRWGDLKVKTISALRKDGKYVEETQGGSKSYVDKKDFEKYSQYDVDIFAEYEANEKASEESRKKYNEKSKEIISRLKPIDISLYFSEVN